MKQIEYTEKQKIVLEVLEQVDKEFKDEYAMAFQKQAHFEKINRIKSFFGIKDKYLTLREYISKASCGAYHTFLFEVNGIKIATSNIDEFSLYYNSAILDRFYVLNDNRKDNGGDCENYHCEHYLEIAEVEIYE